MEYRAERLRFGSGCPQTRIYGIGKYGFGCVVNGLTHLDLGRRCEEEWRERLAKVEEQLGTAGATPYSARGQ